MIDTRTAPYAALVLRASLGILFLAHAALKLFVFTPAGTAQFFGSLGLPPALAYLTIAAELAGGAALVVGFFSRVVAPALIPILLGAIFTVHGSAGFFFTNPNGGWEFLALWIAGLVAVALLGDGAYALRPASLRTTRAPPERQAATTAPAATSLRRPDRSCGAIAEPAARWSPQARGSTQAERRAMIIDCHGHYTTEPAAHHAFREAQVAHAKDRAAPKPLYPSVSDDEIRASIEANQLRLLRLRGADMTIFSPRASGMGHHVGDEAISQEWTRRRTT